MKLWKMHTQEELKKFVPDLEGDIELLQNRLEVSEKEHYRTLQQLAIAVKALKKLTRHCDKWEVARKALKDMEEVR